MSSPSKELVDRAARGEVAAVDELLERHLPGLRAFIRLRAGPLIRAKESGSDLAQSVCREVLAKLDRFQYGTEAGFKHWLYATALRKIKNRHQFYRAGRRDAGREVAIDRGESDGSDPEAADVLTCYESFCSPSRRVMAREEIERIERAFDSLSDDAKTVITMARLEGSTHAEIAAELGKSEGSVRTLLYRSLAALSDALVS